MKQNYVYWILLRGSASYVIIYVVPRTKMSKIGSPNNCITQYLLSKPSNATDRNNLTSEVKDFYYGDDVQRKLAHKTKTASRQYYKWWSQASIKEESINPGHQQVHLFVGRTPHCRCFRRNSTYDIHDKSGSSIASGSEILSSKQTSDKLAPCLR